MVEADIRQTLRHIHHALPRYSLDYPLAGGSGDVGRVVSVSSSRSGAEGATEVEEREETADAAGVVGDGAVADSIVVVGGASVEDGSGVECPNSFDRRLVNIPMMDITLCCSQSPTASRLSNFYRI
jgi:hypothetical protein